MIHCELFHVILGSCAGSNDNRSCIKDPDEVRLTYCKHLMVTLGTKVFKCVNLPALVVVHRNHRVATVTYINNLSHLRLFVSFLTSKYEKNMPLTCEKLRTPQDMPLYVRIPHGNFPVSVLAPCYRRGSH